MDIACVVLRAFKYWLGDINKTLFSFCVAVKKPVNYSKSIHMC